MRLGAKAEVRIYAFREGIASAVGHDLEIEALRAEAEVSLDPPQVQARVDTTSLRTVGAVRGGAVDEGALSRSDRATIDRAIQGEILLSHRFPEATFRSTRVLVEGDRAQVEGVLSLRGVERALSFPAALEEGRAEAEVVLDQTAFGIKPYTAFFGALKIKPNVVVRVSLKLPPAP